MALSTEQMMLIEQRVTNDGPSAGVAWLLLIFLGLVGAHRFYLGRTTSGLLMIPSNLTIVGGFIWLFIDLFLLTGMIRARREEVRDRLMTRMMAGSLA